MYKAIAVEDDYLLQKMLPAALKAEGFECTICPDGESTLELVASMRPDFVILDVNLPDIDGHEVCRRLKADARTRAIPIVMLTGEARDLDLRVRGLEAGAEDYLFKPLSTKVLAARMRSILQSAGRPRK